MNKLFLTGNVGKEPEVKKLDGGNTVVKFPFATSETYKDKSGEKVTNTEWHNIIAWNKLAEIIENWVKKGDKLALIGKITYRNYEDKDGNKKYFTEVVCSDMEMLGSKPTTEESSAVQSTAKSSIDELPGGDIPFGDAPPF